jgi:hypothetical protein
LAASTANGIDTGAERRLPADIGQPDLGQSGQLAPPIL